MVINNAEELDKTIAQLERKKVIQEALLIEQFHATVDHFRPGNLIKSAVQNIIGPGEIKATMLKAVGGLGAGFLAKNLMLGNATSIIGKLAGNALNVGATNAIMHNTDKISAWGTAIFNNLFKKK